MLRKFAAVLGSLAGLGLTANGLRPVSRRGPMSLYAFGLGVFASELPRQLVAVQSAVLLVASRWLPPPVRAVTWLVSITSWLGLLGLDRIARSADRPLNAALDAALGPDREREVGGAGPRGLVGSVLGYRDYVTDANIAYGPHGWRNTLDIWRRPDCPVDGRAPVIIQIHGGAWMIGNKRQQAFPLMSHLAEQGWICVSVNYRLSPRSTWPDHIIDIKRAIAWTRRHIAEYGGDPDWIAVTGGSAGGHLCALAALTPGDSRFQPGFEDADTGVQAAVPFYGVYDLTGDTPLHRSLLQVVEKYVFKQRQRDNPEVFRQASPILSAHPAAPPFFILHGTNDSLVPVEQGRTFAHRLKQVSREPVAYAELPYAQHAFEVLGSTRARHAVVAVGEFLAETRRRSRIVAGRVSA